jgi:Tol biopolymer transport system component
MGVLSISDSGDMAVLLRPTLGFALRGTLARMPLTGGAPREILNDVQDADWAPNGKDLAVIHWVDGRCRLEYPIGNILYDLGPPGWLSHTCVSPDGNLIACLEHLAQRFDDSGSVVVFDRAGQKKLASKQWVSTFGLAWAPQGDEVWFTASEDGLNNALHAIDLSSRERLVARIAGRLILHDIARDGRLLVAREDGRVGMMALPPGETKERDLSWLDGSWLRDMSADGRTILFDEEAEGGQTTGVVYLRKTDGSPAVRLGEGHAIALSPDGKWALARLRFTLPPQLMLLPTGVGEPKSLPSGTVTYREAGYWFPDSKHILLVGSEPNHKPRCYMYDIESGQSHPMTSEGITPGAISPISPDGQLVITNSPQSNRVLFSINDGASRPIPGLQNDDRYVRWSGDGRSLYVTQGRWAFNVYRLNLSTGRREPWKEISYSNPAGLIFVGPLLLTPDGLSHAYTYVRVQTDLFLVEGAN